LLNEISVLEGDLKRAFHQKNVFEQFFQVRQRQEQAKHSLEKTKARLKEMELLVKSQLASFEKIKVQYDSLELLKNKKADLQRLKTINYDKRELLKNEERLAKGAAVLEERKGLAQQIETRIEQFQKKVQDLRANRPDFQKLSQIQLWYSKKGNIQTTLNDSEHTLQELNKAIKNLSDQALHPLQNYILSDTALAAAAQDLKPAQQFFIRKIDTLKTDLKQLETKERKLLVNTKLGDWAEALKDDEPCPLCGSTHHPHLYDAATAKKGLENLTKQIKTRKKELEEIQTVLQNFDQLRTKLEDRQLQKRKLKEKQLLQKETLEAHLKTFIWEDFDPDNSQGVEEAMQAAKVQQQEMEQLEVQLDQEQKALKKNVEQQNRYKEELLKIEEQQHRLEAEVMVLVDNMEVLDPKVYEDEKETNLKQNIDDLDNQIKDISWNYEETEKRLQRVQKEQNIRLIKKNQNPCYLF